MAKILLIDDDAAVREGAGRFLMRCGHDVEEAASGAKALRLAEDGEFELVITDINMPDMDGIEVILALSALCPTVPIIAISGGGLMPSDILLDSAATLGAVTTLPKPFELDHLRDAVERALGAGGDAAT